MIYLKEAIAIIKITSLAPSDPSAFREHLFTRGLSSSSSSSKRHLCRWVNRTSYLSKKSSKSKKLLWACFTCLKFWWGCCNHRQGSSSATIVSVQLSNFKCFGKRPSAFRKDKKRNDTTPNDTVIDVRMVKKRDCYFWLLPTFVFCWLLFSASRWYEYSF